MSREEPLWLIKNDLNQFIWLIKNNLILRVFVCESDYI